VLLYEGEKDDSLKRQLREIFDPCFFSSNNPPRALIHGLKPFRIWLRIRRENRLYSNFSSVIDNAETISAVSLTPPAKINVTPLKSQTDFTSPFSSFKGKIQ
jgi:hypothetical protein